MASDLERYHEDSWQLRRETRQPCVDLKDEKPVAAAVLASEQADAVKRAHEHCVRAQRECEELRHKVILAQEDADEIRDVAARQHDAPAEERAAERTAQQARLAAGARSMNAIVADADAEAALLLRALKTRDDALKAVAAEWPRAVAESESFKLAQAAAFDRAARLERELRRERQGKAAEELVVAKARTPKLQLAHPPACGKTIVRGVDFVVGRGQRIPLRGPNGAGKSTILKCLSGPLPPMAGERRVDEPSVLCSGPRPGAAATPVHHNDSEGDQPHHR